MTRIALLLMLSALTGNICLSEPVEDSRPASTNVPGAEYPRIHTDRTVTFQVRAPDARKVQIQVGKKYEMVRDDTGLWTVTTAPLVPGFHYYSLIVDGVTGTDPGSETFYGMGRLASGIEIPEPGVDF